MPSAAGFEYKIPVLERPQTYALDGTVNRFSQYILFLFSNILFFSFLARESAAVHLLGLRVQVPPGAWISVSCEKKDRNTFFLQMSR